MDHVIELLDDNTGDESELIGLPGQSKPEVFVLLSDEGTPNGQDKTLPSSPREIEVISDTSFQPSKDSMEINAPFCQDLSTTVRDDDTINDNDTKLRPRSGKRILEDILNEGSSIYNFNTEDSIGLSHVNGQKRSRTVIGKTDLQVSTNAGGQIGRVSSGDVVQLRTSDHSDVCTDIFERYPVSSPSVERVRTKGLDGDQPRHLFVQNSDYSFQPREDDENDVSSQVSRNKEKVDGESTHTSSRKKQMRIPLLPLASPIVQRTSQTCKSDAKSGEVEGTDHMEVSSESRQADLLRLELLEQPKNIDAALALDPSDHFADKLRETLQVSGEKLVHHCSRASQHSKLRPFIVHGRCYSDEESERLIQTWLKTNKRAFRESNQIYRSNEKARSCITVTMAKRLIRTFNKCAINLEKGIQPATLQTSADDELPRIGFLRTIDSEYDFDHDVFYPCQKTAVEEAISILYYEAQDFFELYRTDKEYLFKRFRSFVQSGKYLIVVLSNLKKFERALEAVEDRKYKARVQEELTGSQIERANGSKKKQGVLEDLGMKKFDIEQRLRFIDRLWGIKIHAVSSHAEFAESLPNLVSLIAKQRMDPAIRFMRYSHINARSSKDKTDVLRQTLQQINKMPELKANSVIGAYPTFQDLFSDLMKGELKSGLDGKHLMTEAMETRLYRLFMCQNPDEPID